ncbi:MAG: DUF1573 domain-containing protein [Bacteroidales bacterium]|nr:DUF1573 domain-containing protein [Bacteroidales bacterium]
MKKSAFIFLVTIFYTFNIVYAQQGPSIKFDKKKHNFKTIKEDDGPAKGTFHFTNIGDQPLKLTKVKPGCGCTTSDWTKNEVQPGKKGFITAVYDPRNRPGPFNKAIAVETNDPKQPRLILFISGNVLPRKKTTVDFYPVKAGNLRFKTNHLAFMEINNGSTKTDTMKLYNVWDSTMTIKLINVPKFISYEIIPPQLKPKQEGIIIMTYDARKKNDFGLIFDRFSMETNDAINKIKPINVSAKIVEDFTKLSTKQLELSPKIKFASRNFNFGSVKQGELVEYSFEYTNLGEADLIIRKISSSSGCTIINKGKPILKKDESSKMDIIINTKGSGGKLHKTITVISNDPDQPSITLSIIGSLISE